MADTGWISFTTAESVEPDSSPESIEWVTPSNALVDDDVPATAIINVPITGFNQTHWLYWHSAQVALEAAIPIGSTITNIKYRIKLKSTVDGGAEFLTVTGVKYFDEVDNFGGALGDYAWTNSYVTQEFDSDGSISDGTGPTTRDDLLVSTFGLIALVQAATEDLQTLSIDFAQIKVFYTTPPEIQVLDGAVEVTSGQSNVVPFPQGGLNGPSPSKTFTINNTGGGTLTISSVTVPTGFTLTTDPTGTILASGMASLVVTRTNTTGGSRSGNITINSDDGDEPAFTIPVVGIINAGPRGHGRGMSHPRGRSAH